MTGKAIDMKVSCGCGFRTDNLAAALRHSGEYNHQLTISGSVDVEREASREPASASK